MDKSQALEKFWNSFGLPAYDENTVPEDATLPRITYSVSTDSFENVISLNASIWYRSTSWADISKKAEEIGEYITKMIPPSIQIDNGRLYLTKGSPFAQRMNDPDDSIRRILLNIQAEFLTAF